MVVVDKVVENTWDTQQVIPKEEKKPKKDDFPDLGQKEDRKVEKKTEEKKVQKVEEMLEKKVE